MGSNDCAVTGAPGGRGHLRAEGLPVNSRGVPQHTARGTVSELRVRLLVKVRWLV